MHRLTGKTCVVTGAARGIGRAITEAFLAEGAQVIATDKDEAAGAAMAAEIGCRFLRVDVRQEADWAALALAVPEADVVVNNAGVTGFEDGLVAHDPETARLDDWRAVHAVNLDGTFLGCRYAIGAMKARESGSIINISSRSGLVGIPLAAAYASSKAAIRNHTKTVALYCAQKGWTIRCNSIHPDADVGADAGGRSGPGGAHGGADGRHAAQAFRQAARGGGDRGAAGVRRGRLCDGL